MGVLGLWQLLAPVGQPVTLESLENKIFAVDISIWLNQALKGYRDSEGGSVANAHLLSLFSRLCKLLFYKIRPIIVFDGSYPELKRQTIINRQQRRAAVKQRSRDVGLKILTNYLASQNLAKAGGSSERSSKPILRTKEKVRDEIFKLPPIPDTLLEGGYETSETADLIEWKFTNFSKEDIKYLNQIDIDSEDFRNLPADVKQEILSTLKESRRHRTWDQYEELPEEYNEFSSYQMKCLLKKRNLQRKLEEVQKDLRQINSADFVAQYTNDHVIGETNKIMSDDCSHYVLLRKIMHKSGSDSKDKAREEEQAKERSSSMSDTKNAFIKDIENIDVSDLTESKVQNNSAELTTPDLSKVKVEFDFCDKFEEEDVDDPTEISFLDSFKQSAKTNLDFNRQGKNIIEVKIPVEAKSYSSSALEQSGAADTVQSADDIDLQIEVPTKTDTVSSSQVHALLASESPKKCVTNFNDTSSRSEQEHENTLSKQESLNLNSEKKPHDEQSKNCAVISSEDEMVSCDEIEDISIEDMLDPERNSVESLSDSAKVKIPYSVQDTTFDSNCSVDSQESIDSSKSKNANRDNFSGTAIGENLKNVPHDELPSTSSCNLLSKEDSDAILKQMQDDLDSATTILEADQAKQDRQNRTVQEHMVEECKELLQLFGIPYVVSPTEAEAQCAFYDIVDLTHGTITDDSDVWLFGGRRVYKNFFTQQKYVEFYKDNEIFNHFTLSRKKLINFAMLTGSDYTEGIEGVGPVTAMEILSEFPGEGIEALQRFKEWWSDVNKNVRSPENKIRAKLLKLVLAWNFPDEKVFDAYLDPVIDDSTEKFSWGRPDLDALRDYTKERFGWNKSKVDDALLPVIKKLNERQSQTHLDSFFTVNLKKQTELFPSKRIMSALKKMASPQKGSKEIEPEVKKNKRKMAISKKKTSKKLKTKTTVNEKKRTKIQQVEPALSEDSSDEN